MALIGSGVATSPERGLMSARRQNASTVKPASGAAGSTPLVAARRERRTAAARAAAAQGGVVHRAQLRRRGISRHEVRTEILAGRWAAAGRHTVVVGSGTPVGQGRWWQAVWESGAGAQLDGVAALLASGLAGYSSAIVDVSVPAGTTRWTPLPGVRVRRRRVPRPGFPTGIPRVRVEWATLHAAQWAVTDRQAALLVCLVVQQRLVSPERLLGAWQTLRRSPRRELLDHVVRDVCDGVHSLGELDFGRLCRMWRLPPPTRQAIRETPGGRLYLDVEWADVGLVVEIDGGHHALALHPVDDVWRQNEVVLGRSLVLRIPVLGLRLAPEQFMRQVVRAHALPRGSAA